VDAATLEHSREKHFDDVKLTSSLRSVVQVVMVFFILFSVTLNAMMNCVNNYENLLNFAKVVPIILVVPFLSGHGVVK